MFSKVNKDKDDLGVLTQIYDTYIKWHLQFMPRIERNFLYHKISQVSGKSRVQFHLQELRRFHKEGRQISNGSNNAVQGNNPEQIIQNNNLNGKSQSNNVIQNQNQQQMGGNIFDQLNQFNIAELYGSTSDLTGNKNNQNEDQVQMQIDQYPQDLFDD